MLFLAFLLALWALAFFLEGASALSAGAAGAAGAAAGATAGATAGAAGAAGATACAKAKEVTTVVRRAVRILFMLAFGQTPHRKGNATPLWRHFNCILQSMSKACVPN